MAIKISWAIVEHDIMMCSLQHCAGGMATLLIGVQSEYNSCLFRDITEPEPPPSIEADTSIIITKHNTLPQYCLVIA